MRRVPLQERRKGIASHPPSLYRNEDEYRFPRGFQTELHVSPRVVRPEGLRVVDLGVRAFRGAGRLRNLLRTNTRLLTLHLRLQELAHVANLHGAHAVIHSTHLVHGPHMTLKGCASW